MLPKLRAIQFLVFNCGVCTRFKQLLYLWRDAHLVRSKFTAENFFRSDMTQLVAQVDGRCLSLDISPIHNFVTTHFCGGKFFCSKFGAREVCIAPQSASGKLSSDGYRPSIALCNQLIVEGLTSQIRTFLLTNF